MKNLDLCMPCHTMKNQDSNKDSPGVDETLQPREDRERHEEQLSPQEERQQKIQRCIQSLLHATHCNEDSCSLLGCAKMKRVLQHCMACRRQTTGGCRICQELIHLCCYHAKGCVARECGVAFCKHIKNKLQRQQLIQGQAEVLRRRVMLRRNLHT